MGVNLSNKEMSELQMRLPVHGSRAWCPKHIGVMHQCTGDCENADLTFSWIDLKKKCLHRDFDFFLH